jgi:hypothetical protein
MKKHFLASAVGIAMIAAPAMALAQQSVWRIPSDPRYRTRDATLSYYEVRRIAYDEGFREGLKEGDKDRRSRDAFRYEDEGAFRDGDKGYRRDYGDRERYRQAFRSGFVDGYGEGYGLSRTQGGWGNGRWGNGNGRWENGRWGNGGYYSPAFDNGARDGYEKGVEDARRNRTFDPYRHTWFRAGDRHYESRYGSREQYKDLYRRGFQNGYEQGYRGVGSRW